MHWKRGVVYNYFCNVIFLLSIVIFDKICWSVLVSGSTQYLGGVLAAKFGGTVLVENEGPLFFKKKQGPNKI